MEVEVWRGSNKGPRENSYMKYKQMKVEQIANTVTQQTEDDKLNSELELMVLQELGRKLIQQC